MKVRGIIEKDENGYGCFTENLKSTIIGEGASVEEVKASYIESGEILPEELKNIEFEYK